MRAIKIDSENRTITEIELDPKDTLKSLQDCVGGLIELATDLHYGDSLYVNEEGLLTSPEYFFNFRGLHQLLAGNAVVAGIDHETGDTVAATSSVESIRELVTFYRRGEVVPPRLDTIFYQLDEDNNVISRERIEGPRA